MNRIMVAVVAALLVPIGSAVADETHPDCESGQEDLAEGAPFQACEGEQWDGQDPTNTGNEGTGAGIRGDGVFVAVNSDGEPGTPELSPSSAHQVRVAVQVVGDGSPALYYYQGQWGVGQHAAYASADGTVSYWARDGTDRLGVFQPVVGAVNPDPDEGDADGNGLAWVVGVIGTPGGGFKTGEADCTQQDFEDGDCERDNTAVTFHLLA